MVTPSPVGQIWGNAAIFDFQQTWDDVTIVNESDHDIWVRGIDVVRSARSDEIR